MSGKEAPPPPQPRRRDRAADPDDEPPPPSEGDLRDGVSVPPAHTTDESNEKVVADETEQATADQDAAQALGGPSRFRFARQRFV